MVPSARSRATFLALDAGSSVRPLPHHEHDENPHAVKFRGRGRRAMIRVVRLLMVKLPAAFWIGAAVAASSAFLQAFQPELLAYGVSANAQRWIGLTLSILLIVIIGMWASTASGPVDEHGKIPGANVSLYDLDLRAISRLRDRDDTPRGSRTSLRANTQGHDRSNVTATRTLSDFGGSASRRRVWDRVERGNSRE